MRFLALALILCLIFPGFIFAQQHGHDDYYCPMHPDFKSDKPGSCSICGMNLVKKDNVGKIKFYRNPMNPEQTSPTPKKDEMGMDYIPVYEGGRKPEYTSARIASG